MTLFIVTIFPTQPTQDCDSTHMTLLQLVYLKVGFHNSPSRLQQTAVQFFSDSPGVELLVSALAAPCHTCNQ